MDPVAIYEARFFENRELRRWEIEGKDADGYDVRYLLLQGRPLVVDAGQLATSKGFGPPSPEPTKSKRVK